VDLKRASLFFAIEGKGKDVSAFTEDLARHGGSPEKIESVCCDLSPSFVVGTKEHLTNAELVFDHIMKIVNEAVDEVRRDECKENDKKTRYLWLKNPEKLTKKQQKKLEINTRTWIQSRHTT
jgi:Transposase and inactivated derivatives